MPDAVVSDVVQLVEAAHLEAIEVYMLEAHRTLGVDPSEAKEVAPEYTLFVDFSDDGAGFRIRFETRIDVGLGDLACGVLASYTHDGVRLGAGSGEALSSFVNNVALMHVLPYVRQTIADLTTRTFGAPLLMPIIQRGELEFEMTVPASAQGA